MKCSPRSLGEANHSVAPDMRLDLSIALVLEEVVCSLAGRIKGRLICEGAGWASVARHARSVRRGG